MRGGDADLARLPIGPADRGVEELRGRVRRGQHPAAVGGADRDDRGQELDRAVGLLVADLVGGIPHAGIGDALQDAALAELVELGGDLVGADPGRRSPRNRNVRHARSSPGWNISFRIVPSLAYLARSSLRDARAFLSPLVSLGAERLGDQGAAVLDGARDEVAHLAVGALELAVQHDRQCDEDADQHHRFQREGGGQATDRLAPAPGLRLRSCPSGIRRTDSYRFRQRWGRWLGTCF